MVHPEYSPGSEPATPDALGDVFKVASAWIQEHGTVTIGQILSPAHGDDLAPSFEFDGEVVCALFPEAAAALDIRPDVTLSCGFWPAYSEEDDETGETVLMPPECGFHIKYEKDPVVDSVVLNISLEGMATDEWLGNGEKEIDYWQSRGHNLTPEENLRNALEADRVAPPDPISQAECEAMQVIADNFDALKQAQENR